jgi:hypothetical protein
MRRVLLQALLAMGLAAPVAAAPSVLERAETPILGTMPAYPGATRPLPTWETRRLAVAMTPDKPEAVIAYYLRKMPTQGWRPEAGIAAEAFAAASAGQPAWLTFSRAGLGRLEVQVTSGPHPKTGAPLTLIFYERPAIKP